MQTIGVIYTGKNNLLVCHCHLIDTGCCVVTIRLPEKYTGCLDAKVFLFGSVQTKHFDTHFVIHIFELGVKDVQSCTHITPKVCIIVWVFLSNGFSHNSLMMSSSTMAMSYVIVQWLYNGICGSIKF